MMGGLIREQPSEGKEEERSGQRAKEVGGEIVDVIAVSPGDKGLVVFVEDTHQRHDEGDDCHVHPRSPFGFPAEQGGRKKSGSSQEVTEMQDLVRSLEGQWWRHVVYP